MHDITHFQVSKPCDRADPRDEPESSGLSPFGGAVPSTVPKFRKKKACCRLGWMQFDEELYALLDPALCFFVQMNTRELEARRQATTRMDTNEALRIVRSIIG